MKILLFGKNGQIGRRLCSALLPLGEIFAYGSKEVDFRDQEKLRQCIRHHNPDVVVNAVGYTAVDAAESDSENVFAINAEAVKAIADEANEINALLVHYSTDYVFDGTKNTPYTEEDTPNPLNVYGRSKLAADEYIQSTSSKYLILRTSWVFDSYGKNFPKTILSLAGKNESLRVIDDQLGSPISAQLLASTTALMISRVMVAKEEKLSGVYNITSSGATSWYSLACALIQNAQSINVGLLCLPENIIPIPSTEYLVPAKRPMNSRLDVSKVRRNFGIVMPSWEPYIPKLLKELSGMKVI